MSKDNDAYLVAKAKAKLKEISSQGYEPIRDAIDTAPELPADLPGYQAANVFGKLIPVQSKSMKEQIYSLFGVTSKLKEDKPLDGGTFSRCPGFDSE